MAMVQKQNQISVGLYQNVYLELLEQWLPKKKFEDGCKGCGKLELKFETYAIVVFLIITERKEKSLKATEQWWIFGRSCRFQNIMNAFVFCVQKIVAQERVFGL